MSFSRAWFLVATVMVWLLLNPPVAQAHKVIVFAWVDAGQVHTESKFSAGKKVKAGKIEVFDHQENKLLEGVTDEQGRFTFPVPDKAQSLKIVLKAGMGHGNHWTINALELGSTTTDTAAREVDNPAAEIKNQEAVDPTPLDSNAVQRIVENALDSKLAPIKARVVDQAWGLRDILGGLGYILGLVGLAAYLQNRKYRTPNS